MHASHDRTLHEPEASMKKFFYILFSLPFLLIGAVALAMWRADADVVKAFKMVVGLPVIIGAFVVLTMFIKSWSLYRNRSETEPEYYSLLKNWRVLLVGGILLFIPLAAAIGLIW